MFSIYASSLPFVTPQIAEVLTLASGALYVRGQSMFITGYTKSTEGRLARRYQGFDIIWGRISRISRPRTNPNTPCGVIYLVANAWNTDTDWCVQSDVMTNSRVQGFKIRTLAFRVIVFGAMGGVACTAAARFGLALPFGQTASQ